MVPVPPVVTALSVVASTVELPPEPSSIMVLAACKVTVLPEIASESAPLSMMLPPLFVVSVTLAAPAFALTDTAVIVPAAVTVMCASATSVVTEVSIIASCSLILIIPPIAVASILTTFVSNASPAVPTEPLSATKVRTLPETSTAPSASASVILPFKAVNATVFPLASMLPTGIVLTSLMAIEAPTPGLLMPASAFKRVVASTVRPPIVLLAVNEITPPPISCVLSLSPAIFPVLSKVCPAVTSTVPVVFTAKSFSVIFSPARVIEPDPVRTFSVPDPPTASKVRSPAPEESWSAVILMVPTPEVMTLPVLIEMLLVASITISPPPEVTSALTETSTGGSIVTLPTPVAVTPAPPASMSRL